MTSLLLFSLVLLAACNLDNSVSPTELSTKEQPRIEKNMTEKMQASINLSEFQREPAEWGENVAGVKTRLNTDETVMALTFDLCGGPYGHSLDEELLSYLQEEQIAATLFVNERWIEANETRFLALANDPLFQIENHGTEHKPLSISGEEAWGIQGTESAEEVVDEIMDNQHTIERLTGKAPTMFRSGTAHYDDVSVEIVHALGLQVVNFDIVGDAGATYSDEEVEQALLTAEPGSIALLHMNQPASDVAGGVKRAVPQLKAEGFSFVHLDDYPLK